MTMNCPSCGALMVWLNGSLSHEPPVKYYHCRQCDLKLHKFLDGSYEIDEPK